MREKVLDLVYLDTKRYASLANLRVFYWGITIIPFFMIVMGIVSISMTGINWRSLFPLVSIAVWSLLYWIFVLTIQSKRTKKTFELRFLVNGIFGSLISFLFWIFYTSFSLTADNSFLTIDFFMWILLYYLLFSILYICIIIFGVHKGLYRVIREKSRTKTFITIAGFFAAVLPGAGVSGMYASRLLRSYASINIQNIFAAISFLLTIFLPALSHINFVQYYYCKKYGIACDEKGNTGSPELEPKQKKKVQRQRKSCEKKDKRKFPLALKILIGIVCAPIAALTVLLFIGFIISLQI